MHRAHARQMIAHRPAWTGCCVALRECSRRPPRHLFGSWMELRLAVAKPAPLPRPAAVPQQRKENRNEQRFRSSRSNMSTQSPAVGHPGACAVLPLAWTPEATARSRWTLVVGPRGRVSSLLSLPVSPQLYFLFSFRLSGIGRTHLFPLFFEKKASVIFKRKMLQSLFVSDFISRQGSTAFVAYHFTESTISFSSLPARQKSGPALRGGFTFQRITPPQAASWRYP